MKTNSTNIKQFFRIEDAPKFDAPEYKAASIENFNIVRNGTVEGRSSVDIVFIDESGQKYVTMLTGRIIHAVARVIGDEG